jgi:hypothetical protein
VGVLGISSSCDAIKAGQSAVSVWSPWSPGADEQAAAHTQQCLSSAAGL